MRNKQDTVVRYDFLRNLYYLVGGFAFTENNFRKTPS
jgi:hypothetical protein